MIDSTIAQWRAMAWADDPGQLNELLHEDAVFYSPVVHAPQRGRGITAHYLLAALRVFRRGTFEYVLELQSGNHVMLEFVAVIDEIMINGIDLMTFDDDGRITEFKVMARPAKGLRKLQDLMMAELSTAMPGRAHAS